MPKTRKKRNQLFPPEPINDMRPVIMAAVRTKTGRNQDFNNWQSAYEFYFAPTDFQAPVDYEQEFKKALAKAMYLEVMKDLGNYRKPCLPAKFRKDEDVLVALCFHVAGFVVVADDCLKENEEFWRNAIQANAKVLRHMSDLSAENPVVNTLYSRLRSDESLMESVVKRTPNYYEYIAPALKQQMKFITPLLGTPALRKIPVEYRTITSTVAKELVKAHPYAMDAIMVDPNNEEQLTEYKALVTKTLATLPIISVHDRPNYTQKIHKTSFIYQLHPKVFPEFKQRCEEETILVEKLEEYIHNRDANSSEYFLGKRISNFFGGYSKHEKITAATALLDHLKKAHQETEISEIDPKHVKVLKQGRLGQLITRWEQKTKRSVEAEFVVHLPEQVAPTAS